MQSYPLTREDCGILIGRLSAMRERLSFQPIKQKQHRNSNHNPNITMIKCNVEKTTLCEITDGKEVTANE